MEESDEKKCNRYKSIVTWKSYFLDFD